MVSGMVPRLIANHGDVTVNTSMRRDALTGRQQAEAAKVLKPLQSRLLRPVGLPAAAAVEVGIGELVAFLLERVPNADRVALEAWLRHDQRIISVIGNCGLLDSNAWAVTKAAPR